MNKIDLLNRYSKISIVSFVSGNAISANDVQLVYGYNFDVFKFKDNGKDYYFKFNDIIINNKRYNLTENEKLADFVFKKILPQCKQRITNIKNEIIAASKQEKFSKEGCKELIFKTSTTKLNSAQAANGSCLRVIKHDGKYYRDFYDLKNDCQVNLNDAFGTEIWQEDFSSEHDLYVVNSIRIKNNILAKAIKEIVSISEAKGKELARKLEDFCRDNITIGSFEDFNKETDFKKEIIRKFKDSDNYITYFEVDNALAAGYFDTILTSKVKELENERKSILHENKQFKLKVMFYDRKESNFKYEYFDVTPKTTYFDLYNMLLKKCAENLKTDDDHLYIDLKINGKDVDDIENNKNEIKLDIINCTFYFTKSECQKSAAVETFTLRFGGPDYSEEEKEEAKKEKKRIEETIKELEKEIGDNKKLISDLKSESDNSLNSTTDQIQLDIKEEELNNFVDEINKDKENKGKQKDKENKDKKDNQEENKDKKDNQEENKDKNQEEIQKPQEPKINNKDKKEEKKKGNKLCNCGGDKHEEKK